MRISAIVEGHGDAESVGVLLRRFAVLASVEHLRVTPLRINRNKIVKPGELESAVELAARKAGPDGRVLVLLDADHDVVCTLGPALAKRAKSARSDILIAVVLARVEFEAWFLAAIRSLRGCRGIPPDAEPPEDPEAIRGAKEWLGNLMKRRYSEVTDQPALTARFSLDEARAASPSFDKLCREVARLFGKS